MISLQYTHAEIRELLDTMLTSHSISIRVRILDLDHKYIDDVSDVFVDGQVNFDAEADITRSLDLTLFDPFQSIQLDPDSPSRTGIFITNMISVVYVVRNADRTKVWNIPVFCGPVDAVDRDDVYLNLKCLGKEILSIGNLWRGRTFRKGQEKTEVIKIILRTLCGETKLDIPNLAKRMPNGVDLTRKTSPWKYAKKMASSLGYQLFYDGRGVARMRRKQINVSMVFTENWMSSSANVSYDQSKTINAVDVRGRKPKKSKNHVKGRAVADAMHSLSPQSLGRGSPKVPRYLWEYVEDDEFRTNAECNDEARRRLRLGLLSGVTVQFNGTPNPLMEEFDVATLKSSAQSNDFRMTKWTLPLVAGEDAAYGYLKRAQPKAGRRAKPKAKKTARKAGAR